MSFEKVECPPEADYEDDDLEDTQMTEAGDESDEEDEDVDDEDDGAEASAGDVTNGATNGADKIYVKSRVGGRKRAVTMTSAMAKQSITMKRKALAPMTASKRKVRCSSPFSLGTILRETNIIIMLFMV